MREICAPPSPPPLPRCVTDHRIPSLAPDAPSAARAGLPILPSRTRPAQQIVMHHLQGRPRCVTRPRKSSAINRNKVTYKRHRMRAASARCVTAHQSPRGSRTTTTSFHHFSPDYT
jgi:hypothetical protein